MAAVFSGKLCSGVYVKRLGAWHKRPYNFARQRLISAFWRKKFMFQAVRSRLRTLLPLRVFVSIHG